MKEFEEYSGLDLYDCCCGYVLTTQRILEESLSKKSEKRIKTLLEKHNAAPFDADRADYIQKVILEIQHEVLDFRSENPSIFYTRKENTEGYASYADVDIEAMTDHFHSRYSDINRSIIESWISYLVYIWYLR